MKLTKIKRAISLLLAVVMIFSAVAVNSVAAPATVATASPLFEMDSAVVDYGEEFELTIKFARDITSIVDPIAALDVSLEFNKNVYELVTSEIGQGLQSAFDLTGAGDTNLEKNYSFSAGTENPGVVKWSMFTINQFTFKKNTEFMKLKFKVKNIIDEIDPALCFTIRVTNAAEPETLKDITNKFTSFTNEMKFKTELDTKCTWTYISNAGGYRLSSYYGTSDKFVIPATHDDISDENGALPVISVGTAAFRDNDDLREITLGKNVTDVGIAAFMSCSNLKKLIIYSPTVKFGNLSLTGVPSTMVIKCIKGSEVDAFAQEKGYAVEYFDDVADCAVIGADEKLYYTGVPVEFSALKVAKTDGTILTFAKDYTLEYKNNIEIGKATVTVIGMGEYVGEKAIEFDVLCPHHNAESGYYTEQIIYADCTTGGKVVKDCTFCSYHDESQTVPAKEHGECEWVIVADSTCTAEGEKQFVCPDCNVAVEKEVIAKKEHIKGTEWTLRREPTCVDKGLEEILCINCDYPFEWRDIDAKGHTYNEVVLQEPTCTEKGVKADVCEVCSDKINEASIDEIPHTMQWVTTVEPKCGVNGEEAYLCTVCGYNDGTENRAVDALVCTPGEWVIVEEVKCLEDGLKEKYCVHCGTKMDEEIIHYEGHKPEAEWTTIDELTCTQNGVTALLCEVCDAHIEEKTTTAPGHIEGETKRVEPTCLVDGSINHHCGKCNEIYEQEPIKAVGSHTDGEWRTILPSCTLDGAENHHCAVCDEVYESTPIPAKGHTDGEWAITTDGGCENESIKSLLCADCKEPLKSETVPASGHTPEFIPDILPTYNTQGKDKVICSVCKHTIGAAPVRKLSADINDDGMISALDALMILQQATGLIQLEGSAIKNADLDGTGKINSADALIALQLATGILTNK